MVDLMSKSIARNRCYFKCTRVEREEVLAWHSRAKNSWCSKLSYTIFKPPLITFKLFFRKMLFPSWRTFWQLYPYKPQTTFLTCYKKAWNNFKSTFIRWQLAKLKVTSGWSITRRAGNGFILVISEGVQICCVKRMPIYILSGWMWLWWWFGDI